MGMGFDGTWCRTSVRSLWAWACRRFCRWEVPTGRVPLCFVGIGVEGSGPARMLLGTSLRYSTGQPRDRVVHVLAVAVFRTFTGGLSFKRFPVHGFGAFSVQMCMSIGQSYLSRCLNFGGSSFSCGLGSISFHNWDWVLRNIPVHEGRILWGPSRTWSVWLMCWLLIRASGCPDQMSPGLLAPSILSGRMGRLMWAVSAYLCMMCVRASWYCCALMSWLGIRAPGCPGQMSPGSLAPFTLSGRMSRLMWAVLAYLGKLWVRASGYCYVSLDTSSREGPTRRLATGMVGEKARTHPSTCSRRARLDGQVIRPVLPVARALRRQCQVVGSALSALSFFGSREGCWGMSGKERGGFGALTPPVGSPARARKVGKVGVRVWGGEERKPGVF